MTLDDLIRWAHSQDPIETIEFLAREILNLKERVEVLEQQTRNPSNL